MTGQFTTEEEIDGIKVRSQMLEPMEVYALAPRVVQMFLPVLGMQGALKQIASKAGGANKADLMKMFMTIDVVQFMPLLSKVIAELGKPENARLPQELLCRTSIVVRDAAGALVIKQLSSVQDINDALRGKFMLMLKLMWFAASFNFADFSFGEAPSAPINSAQIA